MAGKVHPEGAEQCQHAGWDEFWRGEVGREREGGVHRA